MHVSLCKQIFTVGQAFFFTYVDSGEAAVQNTYIRYHKGCYYHWAITSTPFHGTDDFTGTQRKQVALWIAQVVEHLHCQKPLYIFHFIHPALVMLDQDSNPVFFDFYMLIGGALGDKQHVSSSDFMLLSYGAYIDVNFVVTGIKRRETVIKCAEDVRPLPKSLPSLKLKQMGSMLQSRYPSYLELSVSTRHSLN